MVSARQVRADAEVRVGSQTIVTRIEIFFQASFHALSLDLACALEQCLQVVEFLLLHLNIVYFCNFRTM